MNGCYHRRKAQSSLAAEQHLVDRAIQEEGFILERIDKRWQDDG